MSTRARLYASIGIPLLLIIVVVGAFMWQQHAASTGTTGPTQPVSGSVCSSLKSSASQPLTTMRLALDWTPNTNHTGIYVALNQGWYRAEGIDLQLLPYSANVSPDVLVSSGKADVGVGFTEGIVDDAAVNQPVVSIAAIAQHNTSALVTLASSGLTRPRDLDGKIYGGFGTAYEGPVVGEVIKNDGGKGQFKNVTLNVDAMQALESHRIDFVWVYQGWEVIQAQRDGIKLNVFPITSYGIPDYYTPNLITSPAEIQQKPALLHKFMTATSCGYEYARTHPHEAAQMLINAAKSAFPDPGLVFASQAYLSPRYVDPGRKWGMQDAAVWHGYPQFIINTGGVADASGKPIHSLNIDALYTNQFLM
ncbi:MAG TPA: ABC transporter substrate-binding protein [Ktedonobacteraceae bacterium]|jgi:ABC-type nitrate/sulfonate/bicarbonate transport system substrate-binding protein|nr:ABC transporter substrate-binding protein [Ktedonobacteraceae bacterium]